jgi:hypothetical protein
MHEVEVIEEGTVKRRSDEGRKTYALNVENPDIAHKTARKAPEDYI